MATGADRRRRPYLPEHRASSDAAASHAGASMPAYVLVDISIEDPTAYERYKSLAPPSIARYGGRYLVRGGATTVLEGTWRPARLVVLEFPDAEQARAWWESPEYAEAKRLRQACARTEMLLVEGSAAPATP
jgi:uncharacterized protein (DUF1330 family)